MANPYYTKPRIHFGDYQQTLPQWSGTPQHQPKVLLPGGGHLDANAFTASSNATPITVAAAGASAGATTIPLQSAIASSIPSGKILDFTGAGKFAKLTAAATEGLASLTVEALPQALVSGDMAYYSMGDYLLVQSGTLVGRTYAERDAGIGYGPADVATDEELHLLFFDCHDVRTDNEAELYQSKSGNVVYVNFLPNWSTLPAATKTWIYNNYTCLVGVA